MKALTKKLWAQQNRHDGDRLRLFSAISEHLGTAVSSVLYPGSYCDLAASFAFDTVVYSDLDARAASFFDDHEGVSEIVAEHQTSEFQREFAFIQGDYTKGLGLPPESFDLLVSLYAGFISEHCTEYVRRGGFLLVNPSHGDAAMASIDPRYRFVGAVLSRGGRYSVRSDGLSAYLEPKQDIEVTRELLHTTQRGVAYTKPAFAYLFTRVA